MRLITAIKDWFGDTPKPEIQASAFFAANERRYQYQQAYAKYWNESHQFTKSGRAVDFVLLPVFPQNSFRPGQAGGYLGENYYRRIL